MKNLNFVIAAIFAVTLNITAFAQHNLSNMGSNSNMNMNQSTPMNMALAKTATIKVWGKCDMCKDRIEKTVKAEGATSADWNTKTNMLTVSIDPAKTNVESLSKKLAAVGHDTEKFKADDKAYNALPMCCKYDRTK